MKSFIHNRIHLIDYGKKPTTGLEYPDKEYTKSENMCLIIGNIRKILDKYMSDNSKESPEVENISCTLTSDTKRWLAIL